MGELFAKLQRRCAAETGIPMGDGFANVQARYAVKKQVPMDALAAGGTHLQSGNNAQNHDQARVGAVVASATGGTPGKGRASMTLEELSEYYKLSRYLEMLKEELTRLRAKAYGVGSAKPEISSGAHGGCKSDRTGEAAAKLADMDEELCVLTRECELARERIFRYITVEVAGKDKMTASMMYWRFIGRESWRKVGVRTGNTADNCRLTVKRYLSRESRH